MKIAYQPILFSVVALLIFSGCGHPGFDYVDTIENIQDSVFESHRSEIEAFIQNTTSGIPFKEDFSSFTLSDSLTDEMSEKLFLGMKEMPDSLNINTGNCLFLNNSSNVSMFGSTSSMDVKHGYNLCYFQPAQYGNSNIDPMNKSLSIWNWYRNPNKEVSFPDSVEAKRKKIVIAKKEQELNELKIWEYLAVVNDIIYSPAELEGNDSFISAAIMSTVKVYDLTTKELIFSDFVLAENKDEVATINMGDLPNNLANTTLIMTLKRDVCTQRNIQIFELLGWED